LALTSRPIVLRSRSLVDPLRFTSISFPMASYNVLSSMQVAFLILAAGLFHLQAVSAEEKLSIIDTSNAPAPPAQSMEARLALRQHREVTKLNRFILKGNIFDGTGDKVDHWIVMFCPGWHDKCQGLLPSYELLGVQWENKLNKDLMTSRVRFAKVDCATEKALCVSLDIDDYPSVVHYHGKQRVNSWHGGAPGLVRFVKQELEGTQPRSKRKVDRSKPRPPPVCGDAGIFIPEEPVEQPPDGSRHAIRALFLALAIVAASRALWKTVATGHRTVTNHGALSHSKPQMLRRPGQISGQTVVSKSDDGSNCSDRITN